MAETSYRFATPQGATVTQATPIPGMLAQWATSHIAGGNAEYVDALYEHYLQDPNAIPPEWRDYFNQ